MGAAIALVGMLFLCMGLLALAWPARFARQFGLQVFDRNGRNEVRAVYGGFGVAMAAICGYSLFHPEFRIGILLTFSAALFGMAMGRMISAIVDRGAGPMMWAVMVGESAVAALLFELAASELQP